MSLTTIVPTANNKPIPQVGGNYQQLIDSNPYRGLEYRKSPWQNFMSFLGFRTQADAWQDNMALNAAEYDAAIMQKKYDEQYNDPQSQLDRMRAAGLNPDIDGGSSISPGEAVGLPEDPSTPMQTTGDEQMLFQVGSGVLNAFTTALGIVQSIQGVASRNLQNRLSVIDLANNEFGNFIPRIGQNQEYDFNQVVADSLEMAKMYAGNNLPKRFRNRFVNTIQGFWNSAPKDKDAFQAWSDRIDAGRGYAVNSQSLWSEFSDILWPMAKELADMNTEIVKQSQRTELAESQAAESVAQTEKAYQDELDGQLAGQATNAANKLARDTASNTEVVTSHLKRIMDGLEKSSQEGGMKGVLSSIALSIISGLYYYVQSGIHPHWSSSQSSGSFSGPKGSGSHSSVSRSIGF